MHTHTFKLSAWQTRQAHPWRRTIGAKAPPSASGSWSQYISTTWPYSFDDIAGALARRNLEFDPSLTATCQEVMSLRHDPERLRASLTARSLSAWMLHDMVLRRHADAMSQWWCAMRDHVLCIQEDPERLMMVLDACVEVLEHEAGLATIEDIASTMPPQALLELALHLRADLGHVTQAAHDRIHDHARTLHGTHGVKLDAMLAIIFPEEQSWGNDAIDAIFGEELQRPFIKRVSYGSSQAPYFFASGADIPHMLTLARHKVLSGYTAELDWSFIFDLLVTHGREAIAVIVATIQNSPYALRHTHFLSAALLSHDPELTSALGLAVVTGRLTKGAERKIMSHLEKAPEVAIEVLPGVLDQAEHVARVDALRVESLGALLRRLEEERDARDAAAHVTLTHVPEQAIPQALLDASRHKRKKKPPSFWNLLTSPKLVLKHDPSLSIPESLYDTIVGDLCRRTQDPAAQESLVALQDWVDETSLSALCWHLVDTWRERGGGAREMWVIAPFLRFGSEHLVRELLALVEGVHRASRARLTAMLEQCEPGKNPYLYEALRTLMHGAYSDYRSLASYKLARLAGDHFDRAPDVEDLLDATTPRHGLSDSRHLALDPESTIEVVLDAYLEPHLRMPGGRDDAKLDATLQLRWELVQARQAQLMHTLRHRFERALITQRRWSPQRWRSHIAAHPLLSGMAQRLVWCTFDAHGEVMSCWRLDESREAVDIDERAIDLDALDQTSRIGLMHPLHITPARRARWEMLFADYEIIQPFPQLTRPHTREVWPPERWDAFKGRPITHERLHQQVFVRHEWQAIPLSGRSKRYHGYRIKLMHEDGVKRSAYFKLLISGIYQNEARRPESLAFEGVVHLERINAEHIDPIARSELMLAIEEAFSTPE